MSAECRALWLFLNPTSWLGGALLFFGLRGLSSRVVLRVQGGRLCVEQIGLLRRQAWRRTAADIDQTVSQVWGLGPRLSGAELGWLAASLRRALQAITLAPAGAANQPRQPLS
jgi:hypothetical protein